MSALFTPEKEILGEDKAVLNVLLNCEQTKSSETKQIYFKSLPTTLLEIKKKIEEDFSIPSCVQTLHYQSMILKDSDQLQNTHFRSGDTFIIDYPIEAECRMTTNVVKWLKQLYEVLRSIEEDNSSPDEENDSELLMSSCLRRIETLIMEGEQDGTIEALTWSLFGPWQDKQKLMNQLYFQQEGGLDVLMKIFGILVRKQWGDLGIDEVYHIYLEDTCSMAVGNYAGTIPLRRQIVQLGGLEMCTTTLLRRQFLEDVGILDNRICNTVKNAIFPLCR